MLDWRTDDEGYICNDFIVNLFLIGCLPFFDVCLRNFKFDISSQEILWDDGGATVGIPSSWRGEGVSF